MWVEELNIENVKGFEKLRIGFGKKDEPYPWVTLLGENGTGKSTVLQALALLLAGPEGASQLLKPDGWLRNESEKANISARIHQGANDPGSYSGAKKKREAFQFTLYLTGWKLLTINNKVYSEPLILAKSGDKSMAWLRSNAFLPQGQGWFAAGYGAFRRLTRANRILVPSLQAPVRHNNFASQFFENEPMESFETWMVYLDYRISKSQDEKAKKHFDWGKTAVDSLLPEGNRISHVDADGRIWFDTPEGKYSTVSMSDGFRSVLALAGDLIWRLIEAFPDSANPLKEQGVVLIDELDIHLHPIWQREIAGLLRKTFPNLQFIVATHSPMVAAGAGEDAVTLRFTKKDNKTVIEKVLNLHSKSVDDILKSDAFGLVSEFSAETEKKIQQYYVLRKKAKRTPNEENDYQLTLPFVREALGAKGDESGLLGDLRAFAQKLSK